MAEFTSVLEQKTALKARIVRFLNALPRESVVDILLSWNSVANLEAMVDILATGDRREQDTHPEARDMLRLAAMLTCAAGGEIRVGRRTLHDLPHLVLVRTEEPAHGNIVYTTTRRGDG